MKARKMAPRWIRHTHMFRKDEYECPVCGCCADRPYIECPDCGTPMEGSEYDPSWVDEMEMLDEFFED